MTNKEKIRQIYLNQIKDMDIQSAIKHIDDMIFCIDITDVWTEQEHIIYNILCDIKRNLQKGIKK